MLKKEICEKAGKYHEFFNRKGGEDVYWAYYLLDTFKIINLPEHLYLYTQNPQGITLNYKSLEAVNIGKIVTFLIKQRREQGADY